jgi:galactokinase/mevalonate kinase-like predicted kinase
LEVNAGKWIGAGGGAFDLFGLSPVETDMIILAISRLAEANCPQN